MKQLLAPIILSIFALNPASAVSHEIAEPTLEKYENACNHYVNRARFLPRDVSPKLVVTLADSCLPALAVLRVEDPDVHRLYHEAAENYLRHLLLLRDTVVDMNMERAFGKTYSRWTRMKSRRDDRTQAVPKVSEAGEYLIAYRMGLFDAYQAWLDTTPIVAFALEPGQEDLPVRP